MESPKPDSFENFINQFTLPDKPWEVYTYFWGTAVKNSLTDNWHSIYLKPRGQEVNLDNIQVDIHENGIEFLKENGETEISE